jgi:predicted nucleotidyltransferase component of viral defense system
VQSIERKPRKDLFLNAQFPALQMTIGSAERGTREEARFNIGQASRVLKVEVSFNEPVEDLDDLQIGETKGRLKVYSIAALIAEKLRAYHQQVKRNRSRRQDIYDLAFLIENFPLDAEERAEILRIFRVKCEARDITPSILSLQDADLMQRAQANWHTMQDELREPLPPFEERFAVVLEFYRSLPWETLPPAA